MQKLIIRIVAVISVFTILISITVPAFAENNDNVINFLNGDGEIVFSVPVDEFELDDYCISYQDYLDFYATPFDRPMTFSVGTGGFVAEAERIVNEYANGLAVNNSSAAAGQTLSAPELMLAYFLGGGMIVYGVDGIIRTMIEDVPEVFNDLISDIYLNSSEETKAWLEEAFNLYVDGRLITVPVSVSEDIANILNVDIFLDSEGNTIDTSLSVDLNLIGGVFPDLLPSSVPFNTTDITGPLLISFTNSTPTESVSILGITVSTVYEGSTNNDNNIITFTNNKTGVSLTMPWDQFYLNRNGLTRISKFYKFTDGVKSFWTLYGSYSSNTNTTAAYTPEKHTKYGDNYVKFENTGTVLDGKTFGGVVWDEDASSWRWIVGDCDSTTEITDVNSFLLNATPFDILLSNTGLETAPAPQYYPLKEDFEAPLTYNPIISSESDSLIGVPMNENYFKDLVTNAPEPNTGAEGSPDFNIPNDGGNDTGLSEMGEKIKKFLQGIPGYFKGLYGWLPDEFENKIDAVFLGLSGVIVAMVIVKIVDIVWP